MRKASSIVALLTDFGLHDHYVGTMKAVMLSIEPSLTILDITHEVQPQNVRQASYLLWAAYRYFPKQTLFVCVVDPAVGTSRRIIVVRTSQWTFLAPDAGLLDIVLSQEKAESAVAVDIGRLKQDGSISPLVSSTFHGRDVFAPVAARIARGARLTALGDPITLAEAPPAFVSEGTPHVRPSILHIDRFGNIITNVSGRDREFIGRSVRGIGIRRHAVTRWSQNYESAPAETPCLMIGSSGLVEIAVKRGSAADLLKVDLTTPLRVLSK
jgi:hypothetical protein